MKKGISVAVGVVFLLTFLLSLSCKNEKKSNTVNTEIVDLDLNGNIEKITQSVDEWRIYYSNNIKLSIDFIAFDNQSKKVTKGKFLEELTTGKYIPVKLKTSNEIDSYKLYELDSSTNKGLRGNIKFEAKINLNHYKLEGTKFPEFNFVDINGKHYDNVSTKGKKVVIKCWFIACQACVAEFPELNELANKYEKDDSIQFISLAFDTKEKLEILLLKKPFNFAVVANQKEYLKKTLGVGIYPTHFLINENGIIEKVVNSSEELLMAMEEVDILKGLEKHNIPFTVENRPPPPPPM